MIPTNSWQKSAPNKRRKYKIKQNKHDVGLKNTIEQNDINTWISSNGQTHRQIDYITINSKYRNAVRRAWEIQHWRGNMAQPRQHATIGLDIALKLAKKLLHGNITRNRKRYKI